DAKDDRDRGSNRLCCQSRDIAPSCCDDVNPARNQLGCQRRQSIILTFRPAVFDRNVLALDVSSCVQTLPECADLLRRFAGCPGSEETDHRHRPLLRARGNRPSGYTAADKCDEVPPPHGAYPKAKDHELIIAPCIATRSGHLCPLWVKLDKVTEAPTPLHFRFAPESDRRKSKCDRLLRAKSGLMHRSKRRP